MRLICPNCDAEYAVEDAAIPPSGREVQCSACGHGWFAIPAGAAAPAGAAPAPAAAVARGGLPPADAAAAAGAPAEDGPGAVVPAAPRRQIDETILAVLREEAAREAAARRAEAARGLETRPQPGPPQPGLPQPGPPQPERPAVDDVPPAPPAATAAADAGADGAGGRPAARRDLLPDIEEINSTLRAGADRRGEDGAAAAAARAARRRAGFRRGFLTVVMLAAILMAAYVMAPRIARFLPATAPAMTRYVAAVDRGRVWLDARVQNLAARLRGSGRGATD